MLSLVLAALAALTLSVTPVYALAPAGVDVRVHVPPASENRQLSIIVDCERLYRASTMDVEDNRTIYTLHLERLPVGACIAYAVLTRERQSVTSAVVTFERP